MPFSESSEAIILKTESWKTLYPSQVIFSPVHAFRGVAVTAAFGQGSHGPGHRHFVPLVCEDTRSKGGKIMTFIGHWLQLMVDLRSETSRQGPGDHAGGPSASWSVLGDWAGESRF